MKVMGGHRKRPSLWSLDRLAERYTVKLSLHNWLPKMGSIYAIERESDVVGFDIVISEESVSCKVDRLRSSSS